MQKLKEIAEQIREHQERNGMSDAEFCREYSGLGSTKTYKKILAGDFSELSVERQFENYSTVLELVKLAKASPAGMIYKDMAHVRQALIAVKEAYRETGNDHLVIIEGQTGAGKTEALTIIEKEFGNSAVRLNAHGGWKIGNNPLTIMAADMLEVCKLREYAPKEDESQQNRVVVKDSLPVSFAERKKKLWEALKTRKVVMLIDEGHEIGPFGLNFLKSIINETPTVIALAVIPTIFRRLESKSYEDAIQLTGNRLYERIRIPAPRVTEIKMFLERRGVKFEDAAETKCLDKLAELAPLHANWKFINRFARRAGAVKGPVDAEQCVEYIRAIEKARKGA